MSIPAFSKKAIKEGREFVAKLLFNQEIERIFERRYE